MKRSELTLDGRRISYLDAGGDGKPLLALHGHLEEGASTLVSGPSRFWVTRVAALPRCNWPPGARSWSPR